MQFKETRYDDASLRCVTRWEREPVPKGQENALRTHVNALSARRFRQRRVRYIGQRKRFPRPVTLSQASLIP